MGNNIIINNICFLELDDVLKLNEDEKVYVTRTAVCLEIIYLQNNSKNGSNFKKYNQLSNIIFNNDMKHLTDPNASISNSFLFTVKLIKETFSNAIQLPLGCFYQFVN